MARVKGGVKTNRRHKKVFKLAKGFRMGRRKLYKAAHETVLHAGEYAFAGRRLRKRDFRRQWITRMNAALKELGGSYSTFIHNMKKHNIELDRKVLAYFASEKPEIFEQIVKKVSTKK